MLFHAMTFNLRYDTPNDGPNQWTNRIGKAAAIIRDHDPLIVGTQEGYYAMLKALHERLSDYAWAGTGRHGGQENEHCAIFYKKDELDLVEHRTFWLSETPETAASQSWDSNLPRICTWARFVHRGTGTAFAVFNTHLDHIGQEARNQGARLIWDAIRKHREEHGTPVLLTGDFNSYPGDLPIRFLRGETEYMERQTELKDAYAALDGEIGLTAHSFLGGDQGSRSIIFL
ncbi:endonuclease/exonuclease/phosphatase family protein [Paenibacillus sp. P26]|nr:endonuclease/exonuclease/phosphatase family protein [Paenibacillus sp. P26]UUZ89655.1 endonuclease/exonuclease/phosphatase family protein [Paenibacillus sp. P25]